MNQYFPEGEKLPIPSLYKFLLISLFSEYNLVANILIQSMPTINGFRNVYISLPILVMSLYHVNEMFYGFLSYIMLCLFLFHDKLLEFFK